MGMAASTRKRSTAETYVALLRGINVGGKHLLPMASLAAIFVGEGCTGVRTYIQSGNVVFSATAALAVGLAERVRERVAAEFGFRPPVLLRTGRELAAVAGANPFLTEGADPASLHVGFLERAPTPEQCAALDPDRSPGDRLVVCGREVYLHFPNGVARSKLTSAYLDSILGTTSTFRNWRTVLNLVEMTGA